MSASPTPRQLTLLEHATGLRGLTPQQRAQFETLDGCPRNFYVGSGGGDDWPDLVELAERGLMRRQAVSGLPGLGTEMFVVTPEGFDVLCRHGRAAPLLPFANQGGDR